MHIRADVLPHSCTCTVCIKKTFFFYLIKGVSNNKQQPAGLLNWKCKILDLKIHIHNACGVNALSHTCMYNSKNICIGIHI